MKILLISHYVTFPFRGGNSRFCYILDLLKKSGQHKLELVTSDFCHGIKAPHNCTKKELDELGYKVTLLHEPGYSKNISLKRIASAKVLAKNAKKYLNSLRELPDVIYCAVPSLDLAKAAAKFAKKHNIRYIIDIQDLWPEAFKMAIDIPVICDIAYWPMQNTANYIYKSADEIIAVSQTYVDRGLRVNSSTRGTSIFLGTDINAFDKNANNPKGEKYPKFTAAYIGTLGHSYDIKTAIQAVALAKEQGVNIKLLIMGDGPLRSEFERLAKQTGIDHEFTGKLPYSEMCYRLSRCHVAINALVKRAAQSIINKHGDYAMASIPVLSTQEPGEYSRLVQKYNMGFNCETENAAALSEKIIELYNNQKLREKMGKNAAKCAKECFDRKTTYKKIIDIIERHES